MPSYTFHVAETADSSAQHWGLPRYVMDGIPWAILGAILGAMLGSWLTRRNNRDKASRDLIVSSIGILVQAVDEAHGLIQLHQSGSPVERSRSLTRSREIISGKLRELSSKRQRIEQQLPKKIAKELDQKFRDWKIEFQEDVGLIVGPPSLSVDRLATIRDSNMRFGAYLSGLQHRICRGSVGVRIPSGQ